MTEVILDGSLLLALPIAFLAGLVSFLSPCVPTSGSGARCRGRRRVVHRPWRRLECAGSSRP